MAQQIQLRRGTSDEWEAAATVLAEGELGVETDTGRVKIGNGATAWPSLSYLAGEGGGPPASGVSGNYYMSTMVADARYVADAACNASTHVTSATAAFTVYDEGKIINLSHQRVSSNADGTMTVGSAVLTSATAAFTSADVGKNIVVNGAGADSGHLHVLASTIQSYQSPTQVTLANVAITSTTTAGVFIGSRHVSTISTYISPTEVIMASAPSWPVTGASMVIGTDQTATLQSDISLAVADNKTLYIPEGDYLINLGSGWAVNWTGNLNVEGAGCGLVGSTRSRLLVVQSLLNGNNVNGVFRQGADANSHITDLAFKYVGLAAFYGSSSDNWASPHTLLAGSGTVGISVHCERIDVDGMGSFGGVAANGHCKTRLKIEDSRITHHGVGTWLFRDPVEGDYEYEANNVEQTNINIFGYDGHLAYVHPHTSVQLNRVKWTSNGAAWLLHHYSGSGVGNFRPLAPMSHIRDSQFYVGTVLTGHNWGDNTGAEHGWEVTGCKFDHSFLDLNSSHAVIRNNTFEPGSRLGCTYGGTRDSATVVVDGNLFRAGVVTGAWDGTTGIEVGLPGSSWEILNNKFHYTGVKAELANVVHIHHNKFFGLTGWTPTAQAVLFMGASARVTFSDNFVTGGFFGTCIGASSLATDDTRCLRIDRNHFDLDSNNPVVRFDYDIGHGNVFGSDNTLGATAALFRNSLANTSASLVPPEARSPVALTVTASTLSPGWGHDQFDVTGPSTITNIYVGGTAETNKGRAGDLYLTAVSGAVTLLDSDGNIRCHGGVDLVLAQGNSVLLRANERAGLWHVVG